MKVTLNPNPTGNPEKPGIQIASFLNRQGAILPNIALVLAPMNEITLNPYPYIVTNAAFNTPFCKQKYPGKVQYCTSGLDF